MLDRADQLKILQVYNRAVHPINPKLILDEVRLTFLVEVEQTFGPPTGLTAEGLFAGLIRFAINQSSLSSQASPLPLETAPPVDSSSDTSHIQFRYDIRRVFPGRGYLLPEEELFGEDFGGAYLIATRTGSIRFSSQDLFNTFLTLDLRWTLRDQNFRCLRTLTDADTQAWKQQRHPLRYRLSLYPSTRDRKKIIKFLEAYGPDFLLYPPSLSAMWESEFIDRLNAQTLPPWVLLMGVRTVLEVLGDRSFFREGWRAWLGWNYFVEFNYQYQTFARIVRDLTNQPLPQPPQDPGTWIASPVQQALYALGQTLKGVNLRVYQQKDGALTTGVHSRGGLQECYVLLWEALPRFQPTVKRCGLPGCGRPFFPTRKDQVCCTPQHAARLRVLRSRNKRNR